MKIKKGYIQIVSPILINFLSFNDKKIAAMAFWPFIFYRHLGYKNFSVLENHEKIHHKQQLELLILPFHLLYLTHFIVGLIIFKNFKKAYFNVVFEKEAYQNEQNLCYLQNRKSYQWLRYVFNVK